MPLQVKIKSPEGGTLNTANTYIEDDINIMPNLQDKTITQNGSYTADDGYTGLGSVTVDVAGGAKPKLQEKTITTNGEVTPDEGYDGLSKVMVSIPNFVAYTYLNASGSIIEPEVATATTIATIPTITTTTSAVGSIEK